jgi:NADPH:quinone reductase-like Zn-dependent oxidoreductase
MVQAACIPETFFTCWYNLFQQGGLKAGQTLLVHGGSSGIGTTAIQMATAFGVDVIVTAGSDEKCAACTKLGATHAINYRDVDFFDAVKECTGGKGVDMVLDMVAGDYTQRNVNLLKDDGRLAIIAFLRGPKTDLNLGRVMMKRLTITGSTLRARPAHVKESIAADLAQSVWPLLTSTVGSAAIEPVMDEVFELSAAAAAHERMEGSTHIGKIALIMQGF